jgi:hypothetical protein
MKALCPKCSDPLTYVTSVAHPKSPLMRRTTFLCTPCNRTWSYSLSPAMAEAYAAADEENAASSPDTDTVADAADDFSTSVH